MDEQPPSLLDLLAKHQQGIGGATAISVLFSMSYALVKGYGFKKALQGIFIGSVFSGTGWLFLAEYFHLAVFFVVPVGLGGAYGAFPLVRAWARRDDRLADKVIDAAASKIPGEK